MEDEKSLPNEIAKFIEGIERAEPKHEFQENIVLPQGQINMFESFAKTARCGEMREEQLEMVIITSLKEVSIMTLKKLEEGVIRTYIAELKREFRGDYNWLRVGEFKHAMVQGAKGHYGEVYNLSYTTIYGWIRAYRDSEERTGWIEYAKTMERKKQLSLLPEAKFDQQQHLREMTTTAWQIYVQSKNNPAAFMLMPVEAFRYLEQQKLIVLTKEEKLQYQEIVLAYLKAERKNNMRGTTKDMLSEYPFMITTDEERERLRNTCRRWVVAVYFQSLINSKKDLQL